MRLQNLTGAGAAESMGFGERMRLVRKDRGMTQQQIAELTGLTVGYVSKLERDEAEPSASTVVKVAKAMGASTDGLLFDAYERGPSKELRLLFEMAERLPEAKQEMVKEFILTVVQRHQAQELLDRQGPG